MTTPNSRGEHTAAAPLLLSRPPAHVLSPLTHCRRTLTDPDLINLLAQEDVICWGGDVRDRDAYQGTFSVV